ncbi:MAG: hypothetical protein ABIP91_06320 [Sphingomicrobium sp.]
MSCIQAIALAGIGINLAGVLVLFIFGMPYRVETKGQSHIILEQIDEDALRIDRRYRLLGWLGLILTLAGAALQALAVVWA